MILNSSHLFLYFHLVPSFCPLLCASSSVTMAQVVLPALIPDIPRIYEIYFDAFRADKMGALMLQILFPGTIDEEFLKAHAAGTLSYWHISNCQYTLKVVDTASGDIIGMGLGDVYLHERSEEERANHGVPWLEGEQRERAERVLNPLWEVRERLFGHRRYICTCLPCPVALFPFSPAEALSSPPPYT